MATWTGWEAQFLAAAQVPDTTSNVQFLDDWARHANTDCRNNPIDLSTPVSGSTNCASLPAITARAQNYTTHANAAHAFYVQTHAGYAKALLAALKSGDPYTVTDTGTVATDISAWGSQKFAEVYFTETAGAPGRGGGGGIAPQALKGWHDVRRSVNTKMPAALQHSEKMVRRALQDLSRASRVRG
jgi:hypothetical protein